MEKLLTKIPFVKYNQCNIIHAISITNFHRVIRLSNNSFDSSSITEKNQIIKYSRRKTQERFPSSQYHQTCFDKPRKRKNSGELGNRN